MADTFFTTISRIDKKPILYSTPNLESRDRDKKEDWKIKESIAVYKIMATKL